MPTISNKGYKDASLFRGVISRLYTVSGSGSRSFLFDIEMGETNAGGPVTDAEGNVCGVYDREATEDLKDEYSVAIGARAVRKLLKHNGVDFADVTPEAGDEDEDAPASEEADDVSAAEETSAEDEAEAPVDDAADEDREASREQEQPWQLRALPVLFAVFLVLLAIVVAIIVVGRARRRGPRE